MRKHYFLKNALCLFMAMLCNVAMQAKVEHLLPKVHSLTETKGTPFALKRTVTINYANGAEQCALLEEFFTDYGCTIGQDGAAVTVQMVNEISGAYDYTLEGYDNEGYQLIVETNAITINAVKPIGVIRAAQTLAQLAEGYEEGQAAIETVEITDWAAFKLRGYMHDVGRSFISVAELKKHIDLLSRFKVNTFHWHFTENQAWRFEVIDKDPNNDPDYTKLTSTESMTRFEGKYYTQAECREVAAYAHERGVTIIPEIDMPGHSAAFKRAMGFSMQTDEGVEILKEVLTQVADVFPNAPYIHIGADEEEITYENFLGIMAGHIHELGRKMVVWNPIRGVGINSTMCDMTQMWSSSGANINGVPDIDCRYNYTNHFDVFADVVGIYKSNIYYADKGSEEIAGTISAYWNDRKTPTEVDIVKQNNMYANVIASAERAWIGSKVNGNEGYIEKLGTTLPNSGEVYEEFKSWEERFLFHKAHSLKDEPIPYVKQTNVRWRITDPFPNGGNSGATFAPDQYATSTNDAGLIPETFTHEGKTYYTGMATGAGIYLRHTWGNNIIPTYYGTTNHSNMTAYAWTYVYSPKTQAVGAQIEFQNYGRSETDSAPDAGKWDRKGSDIWLNGSRINPPTWDNTGKGINNEVDLGNENFTARNPIEVQLNEGWNKVFIKLPYVGAGGVRLNKWMFTCVFTDLEGKNAVEGLIYSPNQCMDESTEAVAAEISNIKRDRGNLIGTAIGLWPESAATGLDAKVAEIEATYSATMTADQRAAQVAELENAWTAFTTSLTIENMNKPVSGNYYRMYTPQRDNRYPTGKGAGNAIIGEQNPATNASIWQFVTRSDGSYNIINSADGTYISPASSNNTALNCVTEEPNAGWTLSPAATKGLVIFTSGSAQFNQTNSGQSYKLYNWGSGNNTTDAGCQYALIATDPIPTTTFAILSGLEDKTYPYVAYKSLTSEVFGKESITIAVDVTMPASFSGHQVFVCAADPTQPVVTTAIGTSPTPYVAAGLNGANLAYHTSSRDGDVYTQKSVTLTASTRYQLVFVFDKTNQKFKSYINGSNEQSNSLGNSFQDLKHFATNDNAKLYIGGGMTSAGAQETFGGTIHSVHFFEGALSAADIAKIDYSATRTSIPLVGAEELVNGGVYTFVTPRGWVGANDEDYAIGTVNTTVTPAPSNDNIMFQWALYQSKKGNNYLYNLGKQQFLGVPSNGVFPFVDTPTGKNLTFKNNGKTDYPIMFSTDNRHAVSQNANAGLFAWEGGWNNMNDDGSNHKVTLVSMLPEATLQEIAAIVDDYEFEGEPITGVEKFVSGGIYNFETTRGWMGATESCDNVISTAKTSHGVTGTAKNPMFQWALYQSKKGNYYLYNLGKKMFMGVQSSNNASIPFVAQPTGKNLTFKNNDQGSDYPIMFSTDNNGVANHSDIHGDGLITWTGGWNDLDDEGSNHKVSFVSMLPEATLQKIAAIVADYEFDDVPIKSAEEFENGGIYTFETARGKMGATEGGANAISTARTSVSDTNTDYFKWTVYKSNNGNYYLYNLGKQQFMGVQTANNSDIAFVEKPAGKNLTFKQSSSAEYPIMFSTDNAGVVNHSPNHGGGLVNWTGGWNTLDDGGSNHKVTLVSKLPEATLQDIAAIVENYDKSLPIKVEVEGWTANNPNTHFGNVTATTGSNVSSTKLLIAHMAGGNMSYSSIGDEVTFTRAYRGFEFQGFHVGEQSLGKSFELTEAVRASITEETPLVAKFTTTNEVTLFYDDDPFSYRIPAITTTGTGRLFAVSDYRHNLDDIGRDKHSTGTMRIDLVARYSDNNGKTWSETMTIAAGDNSKTGSYLRAFGDAAIVAVGENIVVMAAAGDQLYPYATTESPNRMVRIFSSDNGMTWSKEEMTTKMYNSQTSLVPNGVAAFFGSGKLVVDANFNGTEKARIYGALLVRTYVNEQYNNYNNYVVYSDDLGVTWSILGGSQTPVANGDEPKVEILPNGQILLSARRGGGRVFNVFTYTDKANNAGTWDTAANGCGNGGSNATNGEIFCIDAKKADGTAVKLLLQSQPKGGGGQYDRKDVTIWYKEIDANTTYSTATIKDNWIEGLQVSHQQSSYSAVTMQPDGKIALFFEEAPCYADNYEKGYCMVYVPLTIEQITKGNYFSPGTDLEAESTINVVLTDAQGNKYRDQVESTVTGVATALTTKHPFITLGDTPSLESDGTTYTYTNTVTLPFKVSSAETTIWHNMYIPSNTNTRYPVYFYAESNGNTTVKTKATSEEYGASDYNTQEHADKMSWAIYNVDNGFAFTFKNKLTGKYIKVAQPASSKSENVQYDTKENATAFSIEKNTSYRGDYIIKHETGHLSVYGAGDGYLTFFSGNYHWGSTVKIVEAPDFEALITAITEPLESGVYGDGFGQYQPTDDTDIEAIRTAMESSNSVKLNTLNNYKELLDGATLNMPEEGQYFRVAYDYGGNVGKLYMQGTPSSVKGVAFTAETGNASIWLYHDGALYSYTAGKNLREHGNDRGLSDTKTTVEFSASTRAKGKYNLKCGSFVHANSSNGNYYTDHCSGNNCVQHDLILEAVDMRPSTIVSTIGKYEVGTFYANEAMIIPEGVTAYVATAEPVMENGEGIITMNAIKDGIIPAQTGVLICGAPNDYEFITSTESGTPVEGNLLKGYAGAFEYDNVALESGYTTYVLTVKNEVAGFYKKTLDFKVYYNKAYLQVPSTQAANLRIRFGKQEGTTDIESAVLESQGSVLIYDLTGRRVMNVGKGIYIVNGKKMIF